MQLKNSETNGDEVIAIEQLFLQFVAPLFKNRVSIALSRDEAVIYRRVGCDDAGAEGLEGLLRLRLGWGRCGGLLGALGCAALRVTRLRSCDDLGAGIFAMV